MRIIFNWVQYVAKCNIKVKTTAKYRHLIFFSSEQNIMIDLGVVSLWKAAEARAVMRFPGSVLDVKSRGEPAFPGAAGEADSWLRLQLPGERNFPGTCREPREDKA